MSRTAVVFGVFDRLHKGHGMFLNQVAQCCDNIIVVVARDSAVLQFKKRLPWQSEELRVATLCGLGFHAELGDLVPGTYSILRQPLTAPSYRTLSPTTVLTPRRPDLICLGYDQTSLAKDLAQRMEAQSLHRTEMRFMLPYKAHKYHTSLLYPRQPIASYL